MYERHIAACVSPYLYNECTQRRRIYLNVYTNKLNFTKLQPFCVNFIKGYKDKALVCVGVYTVRIQKECTTLTFQKDETNS